MKMTKYSQYRKGPKELFRNSDSQILEEEREEEEEAKGLIQSCLISFFLISCQHHRPHGDFSPAGAARQQHSFEWRLYSRSFWTAGLLNCRYGLCQGLESHLGPKELAVLQAHPCRPSPSSLKGRLRPFKFYTPLATAATTASKHRMFTFKNFE